VLFSLLREGIDGLLSPHRTWLLRHMVEKLAHNTLINILADAHEQDVSRLHVNIG